jgi:hypothetical protein
VSITSLDIGAVLHKQLGDILNVIITHLVFAFVVKWALMCTARLAVETEPLHSLRLVFLPRQVILGQTLGI